MLGLRGSDSFSRDRGRLCEVRSRSLGVRSYCRYAVEVTLTYAPLTHTKRLVASSSKEELNGFCQVFGLPGA